MTNRIKFNRFHDFPNNLLFNQLTTNYTQLAGDRTSGHVERSEPSSAQFHRYLLPVTSTGDEEPSGDIWRRVQPTGQLRRE